MCSRHAQIYGGELRHIIPLCIREPWMVHVHLEPNPFQTHSGKLAFSHYHSSLADPQSEDHTCVAPIISQDTFFATQSFSVAPAPTENLTGWASQAAYTVFADVSAETPGTLPIDPQAMTPHERVAVGLGVTAGILAAIGVVATIWWLRRRRRYEAEASHFPVSFSVGS